MILRAKRLGFGNGLRRQCSVARRRNLSNRHSRYSSEVWKIAKSSHHASKFWQSSLKHGSTQPWQFAALLQPPSVVLVGWTAPSDVINAWKCWLSGCTGSCQYLEVKSRVANACEPRISWQTVSVCGIGPVFFMVTALTRRYSTVSLYIAGVFLGSIKSADTHFVQSSFSSVPFFQVATYGSRQFGVSLEDGSVV